ncbi:MAG: glycosyltransferase [Fibrobacterota bacterium]|nr:glycosyltransferase [Chitinispirillaceae bacterium]
MAKVDLHVHSSYSERPSEWFLQRLGTKESYIDPDDVYKNAKNSGMDFVTITDHNTIEGAVKLKQKHPNDVIIGLEATAYFPEDGTKIHILIWGLTEAHFKVIDKIRTDIYKLREYLVREDLAHAVAHVTFAINRSLSFEQIERLFVLFDYFETHNGSRERINRDVLENVFTSLTIGKISELAQKYSIEPVSTDSWNKGRVGGSDDHSGLFTGKTYSCADATTIDEFLLRIKQKRTRPYGRHNDYQGLAFAIYKVAYDFSQTKNPFAGSILSAVNSLIFDDKVSGFKNQAALKKLQIAKLTRKDPLTCILADFVNTLQSDSKLTSDEKLEIISSSISKAADEMMLTLFQKITDCLRDGDLAGLLKSVSGALPGVFISIPFFSSLNVMHQSRWLLDALSEEYIRPADRKKKKVLWFTDTFLELSGVSATLQELAKLTLDRKLDMRIVTCLPSPDQRNVSIPENVIDLPSIHSITPEFFNTYTLRIPSVMAALKIISDEEPDEVYISTPGAVGLLGILVAKLFHIPSTAVYHTDFTRQFRQIIGDETMCQITEDYVNWFHSLADTVAVPTQEYANQLERRGISKAKLRKFRRGIDPTVFAPGTSSEYLSRMYGINDGITLIHSGRVSKEKNLDFLASVYTEIVKEYPETNLLIVGDGPYYDEFREKMREYKRVVFAGRVDRKKLPLLYAASNLLVFPSVTDTFGMVVLEAQSCGLPALVSDFGGPQEIILNGKTGFVAEANNGIDWKNKIEGIISMIRNYPKLYLEMRVEARKNVMMNFNWDRVLDDIFNANRGERMPNREKEANLSYCDIVNIQ